MKNTRKTVVKPVKSWLTAVFCAMVVLYFPAVRNVPGAHEVTGSSLRLHLHQSTQKFMSGTNLHFPRNTFVYSG